MNFKKLLKENGRIYANPNNVLVNGNKNIRKEHYDEVNKENQDLIKKIEKLKKIWDEAIETKEKLENEGRIKKASALYYELCSDIDTAYENWKTEKDKLNKKYSADGEHSIRKIN